MSSSTTVGIVIQARVGSSRLPGKVARPFFEGKNILEIIIDRLKQTNLPVVLATTTHSADDLLETVALSKGITCFRGSENNVLDRFIQASSPFEYAFRICADNPFLSMALMKEMRERAQEIDYDFDYMSYRISGIPAILTHFGVFGELVRSAALLDVASKTQDAFYLEHVTNYIYKHPAEFNINWLDIDNETFISPDIRMTVDTQEDFELIQNLYVQLTSQFHSVELDAVNTFLEGHPEYMLKMKKQKEINTKK